MHELQKTQEEVTATQKMISDVLNRKKELRDYEDYMNTIHNQLSNSTISNPYVATTATTNAHMEKTTEAGYRVIKIENGWIVYDSRDGKRYYCETREAVGNMITTLLTFLEN